MSDIHDFPTEHDPLTEDELPVMDEVEDVDVGSVVSAGDIEADPVDEIEQSTPAYSDSADPDAADPDD